MHSAYAATVLPDITKVELALDSDLSALHVGHGLMYCQLWTDILGEIIMNVIRNQERRRETRDQNSSNDVKDRIQGVEERTMQFPGFTNA